MSITVTGGTDGITARLDDMRATAYLLQTAAQDVDAACDELDGPSLLFLDAVTFEGDYGYEMIGAIGALIGPGGPLALAADRLHRVANGLLFAADHYHDADHSIWQSMLGFVEHMAYADVLLQLGRVSAAGDEFMDGLPDAAGLLPLTAAASIEALYARTVPDGHPVLHDEGLDTSGIGIFVPRDLTDLVDELAKRNSGRHGEISVSFVVGADGQRRAIVDVPGTKSWNPAPNHDITSLTTNTRAIEGRDTSYEQGIFAALAAAGVTAHEQVMVVGHSEGGMVAVDAARDAAATGRFRITHVVTAGAPIGTIAGKVPASVQVLALENSADLVPRLDGRNNPDRPNITTVTAREDHHSVTGNHAITGSYRPIAEAADESNNASVEAFTSSAHGFFDGTSMHTHVYRVTRG
jgi:hypothetical protein